MREQALKDKALEILQPDAPGHNRRPRNRQRETAIASVGGGAHDLSEISYNMLKNQSKRTKSTVDFVYRSKPPSAISPPPISAYIDSPHLHGSKDGKDNIKRTSYRLGEGAQPDSPEPSGEQPPDYVPRPPVKLPEMSEARSTIAHVRARIYKDKEDGSSLPDLSPPRPLDSARELSEPSQFTDKFGDDDEGGAVLPPLVSPEPATGGKGSRPGSKQHRSSRGGSRPGSKAKRERSPSKRHRGSKGKAAEPEPEGEDSFRSPYESTRSGGRQDGLRLRSPVKVAALSKRPRARKVEQSPEQHRSPQQLEPLPNKHHSVGGVPGPRGRMPVDGSGRIRQQQRFPSKQPLLPSVPSSQTPPPRAKDRQVFSNAINRYRFPLDLSGAYEEQDANKPYLQYNYYDVKVRWDQEDPALDPSTYNVDSGYLRLYWSRRATEEVSDMAKGEDWWDNYQAGHPVDLTHVAKFVYSLHPRSVLDFKPMFTLVQGLLQALLDEKLVHILDERARTLAECEARLAEMEAACRARLADLEAQLAAALAALAAAQAAQADSKEERRELEAQHAAEMAAERAKVAALEADLAARAARIGELEAAMAAQSARMAELEAQNKAKDERIADLEAACAGKDKAIAGLRKQLKEKDDLIASLQAQALKDAEELARLLAELERLRGLLSDSEAAARKLQEEMAALKAAVDAAADGGLSAAAAGQLAALQAEAAAKDAKIADLEARAKADADEIARLRALLEAMQKQLEEREALLAKLKEGDAGKLAQDYEDLLRQLNALKAQLAEAEGKLARAQADLAAARSDLAQAQSALAHAQTALAQAQSDLARAQAEAGGGGGPPAARELELLFGEEGAWRMVTKREHLLHLAEMGFGILRRSFGTQGELTFLAFDEQAAAKGAATPEPGQAGWEDGKMEFDSSVPEVVLGDAGNKAGTRLTAEDCALHRAALESRAVQRGEAGPATARAVVTIVPDRQGAGPWGCAEVRGPPEAVDRAQATPSGGDAGPCVLCEPGDPVRGMDCVSLFGYGIGRALQSMDRHDTSKLLQVMGDLDHERAGVEAALAGKEQEEDNKEQVKRQSSRMRIKSRLSLVQAALRFGNPAWDRSVEIAKQNAILSAARKKLEKMLMKPAMRKELSELCRYPKPTYSVCTIMTALFLMLDYEDVLAAMVYDESIQVHIVSRTNPNALLQLWICIKGHMNVDTVLKLMAAWLPVGEGENSEHDDEVERLAAVKVCLEEVDAKAAARGSKCVVAVREWVEVVAQLRALAVEEEQIRRKAAQASASASAAATPGSEGGVGLGGLASLASMKKPSMPKRSMSIKE